MPLTVEGILAALGSAPAAAGSAIEIPFGLVMSPGAAAGGDVRACHTAAALHLDSGVHTRLPQFVVTRDGESGG